MARMTLPSFLGRTWPQLARCAALTWLCAGCGDASQSKSDATRASGTEGGSEDGASNNGGSTGFDDSSEGPVADGDGAGCSDCGGAHTEPSAPNQGPGQLQPGQLTAGEWQDLAHWDFFRSLFDGQAEPSWSPMQSYWGFDTAGRIPVTLSHDGTPLVDAQVLLKDKSGATIWEARSDVHGFAELYASMFDTNQGPFTLVASDASAEAVKTIDDLPKAGERIVLELAGTNQTELSLDMMLMVDTTGSMGDELQYLQRELANVIERVQTQVSQDLDLRLSVNFYRDQGDAYVVRSFPFTSDVNTQLSQLAKQSSGGGGDVPEAVDLALQNAILEHEWSQEATARLLFLVLDAPPHRDDQGVLESLHELAQAAAKRGIQIIPVSASGIDKDTEFLLRFLAVATNGTYTFLTDDSGIGDPHLDPGATIGDYKVELLNDLLVRVVSRQLGSDIAP